MRRDLAGAPGPGISTTSAWPASWPPARSGSGVPEYQIDGPIWTGPVPIAKGKILEPRQSGPTRVDRVGRLAAGTKTNDRTMRDTNPDRARRRFDSVHPFGEIATLALPGQGRRKEHGAWTEIYRLGLEMQVNIGGWVALEDPIPDTLWPMRIMVPRQQVPLDITEPAHSLQRFK